MNHRVPLLAAVGLLGLCMTACTTVVIPPGPTRVVTVPLTPSPQPTTNFLNNLNTPPQNQQTTNALDAASLDSGVTNILENDYHYSVSNVNCPGGEQATVGNVFSCTATISGQQKQVQITVKTADGQYEVAQPQ